MYEGDHWQLAEKWARTSNKIVVDYLTAAGNKQKRVADDGVGGGRNNNNQPSTGVAKASEGRQ